MGRCGKLYRDVPEKVSPTTAGNTIDDSSKTSFSPERQITVNTDNDLLRHLTAKILHFSLKYDNLPSSSTTIYYIVSTATIHLLPVQQISADVNEDLQCSLLHPNSLFSDGTADLQQRQRPTTVFTVTI